MLAALCLALIGFEQLHPLAFRAPTLRAVVETELTLCALAAAWLFAHSFRHQRRLRDLLLVGALLELALIDLISYVLPAAIGLHSPGILTATPVLGRLFVAAAIAAAALAPDRRLRTGRRPVAIAVGAAILVATVAELAGLALRAHLAAGRGMTAYGFMAALGHPLGVLLTGVTTALLIAAAVATVRADRDLNARTTMMLGAAMVTFAAASLNSLVLPTHDIGWITTREGLRLAACGLILVAALRQETAIRQVIAEAAAANERQRIARDLHDGLAQDLAFIAAHGDRIASEEGEDHPLAIAARRALAVSRGAIADLSASEAPSATAALRQVADELELRLGVSIEIEAEDAELNTGAREDVVRIAREAIVNAAHGQARNITVSLARSSDRFLLRVRDDGAGIDSGQRKSRPGFGLRSMRERAASLGGGLDAHPAVGGGTELEVTFP